MTRHRVRFLVLLALAPLAAGCFRYTAAEPLGVRPGTPVRAHFEEPREMYVGNLLVPSVAWAQGDLIRITRDSAIISVQVLQQSDATRRGTDPAVVSLSRAHLGRVEEKKLDRAKTALLAGGVVVVGSLLLESLLGGETGGTVDPGPDPGPIAARMGTPWLFRFPFPF